VTDEEMADLITKLVGQIRPILAGHPAQVQGAVLADLTGTWLAGHRSRSGNAKALREHREKLLAHQIDFIWQHVEVEDSR
jgi:hypothetical protein